MNKQTIFANDRVAITTAGTGRVIGIAQTVQFHDGQYGIEMIDEQTGRQIYWKQWTDGGTIVKLQGKAVPTWQCPECNEYAITEVAPNTYNCACCHSVHSRSSLLAANKGGYTMKPPWRDRHPQEPQPMPLQIFLQNTLDWDDIGAFYRDLTSCDWSLTRDRPADVAYERADPSYDPTRPESKEWKIQPDGRTYHYDIPSSHLRFIINHRQDNSCWDSEIQLLTPTGPKTLSWRRSAGETKEEAAFKVFTDYLAHGIAIYSNLIGTGFNTDDND